MRFTVTVPAPSAGSASDSGRRRDTGSALPLRGLLLRDLPLRGLRLALPLTGLLLSAGCIHSIPEEPQLGQSVQTSWEASNGLETGEPVDLQARWWEVFNDPVLNELIAQAQERNLDLRLAAERVREAQALRRGAAAGLWPELSGLLGARRSHTLGSGTRSNFSAGAEVTWEVDVSGRLAALSRAADSGLIATAEQAQSVRLALLAEVAEAYVEYRLQNLLLEITVESVRLQEATQQITLDRYEAGMASDLDVQRGLSVLARTRSDGAMAIEAAQTARFVLAYLLAVSPEQVSELLASCLPADASIEGEPPLLPSADVAVVLLSPAQVLEQRPDVRSAWAQYAQALASYDAAQAARLPRLTLGGMIGLENERLSEVFQGRNFVWTAAGNLTAPLLDFGRRRSEAEAAGSRSVQAELAYERTVRAALRETQTAIVSYLQGEVRQQELLASMVAAEKAAQIATFQYEEGVLSQLELIDAEKTLHESRSLWAASSAGVAARLIDLYRVMGIAPADPELAAAAQGNTDFAASDAASEAK